MLQHPVTSLSSPMPQDGVLRPRAVVLWSHDHWAVWTEWTGVALDRPRTTAISTGPDRRLADRVAAAIDGGAAYGEARVRQDVNGRTYVEAEFRLWGRRLHQDLRSLGY